MRNLIKFCLLLAACTTVYGVSCSKKASKPLYLTPLIDNGQIEEAQKQAKVPKISDELKELKSYAGLFTVNKKRNSNIFFWYFVAKKRIVNKKLPIILWLNGGPGTTSMLGLIQENGPFYVDNNLIARKREYSWHKNHHLIYMDNPVGVGYSFTDSEKGYAKNTQDCADNLHSALVQFFKMFPKLKENDLYIIGESYGGKYGPVLGEIILKKNVIKNLKGVGIGNGITDPVNINIVQPNYLHTQGFVDEHGRKILATRGKNCNQNIQNYINKNTTKTDEEIIQECLTLGNPFDTNSVYHNLTGYTYEYNILYSYDLHSNTSNNREAFMNLTSTRDAIHVGDLRRIRDPISIQKRLGITMLLPETKSVEYLLNHKVRVLVYTGQLDVCVPYIGTVNYIKQLDFPGKELYRTVARNIWYVDEAVAGYWKQAEGLTEVMVVGAGHMVPTDQPKRAYDLIYKFTRNQKIS